LCSTTSETRQRLRWPLLEFMALKKKTGQELVLKTLSPAPKGGPRNGVVDEGCLHAIWPLVFRRREYSTGT
jgi:hypothetical protein